MCSGLEPRSRLLGEVEFVGDDMGASSSSLSSISNCGELYRRVANGADEGYRHTSHRILIRRDRMIAHEEQELVTERADARTRV